MKPMILTTLPLMTRQSVISDVLAGLTVSMVSLPLCLAIAIASDASPIHGLISAIIGGLIISLFGGSRVQIGGPTGAFIVVVAAVIGEHGYDGLLLATLMAGIILIVAGYFKIGSLIRYIPEVVIHGFTLGIAIIIARSQLASFSGFHDHINPQALMLGMFALITMFVARKQFPRLPTPIFIIAILSTVTYFAGWEIDTLQALYGELPSQFPSPSLPDFDLARLGDLLPSAFLIAFLAGVESLLSATVADKMIGETHRPNAEILAQGLGNFGAALFGGLPVTGAIARTATNVSAGGRSPVSGIVNAIALLMIMFFAASLCGFMAMPTLAAILLMAAWNMAEPHKLKHHLSAPKTQVFIFLLTASLTVFVDLTTAIAVGTVFGLADKLKREGADFAKWRAPKR